MIRGQSPVVLQVPCGIVTGATLPQIQAYAVSLLMYCVI